MLKEKYGAKFEFLEGREGVNQKKLSVGAYGYFLEPHIIIFCISLEDNIPFTFPATMLPDENNFSGHIFLEACCLSSEDHTGQCWKLVTVAHQTLSDQILKMSGQFHIMFGRTYIQITLLRFPSTGLFSKKNVQTRCPNKFKYSFQNSVFNCVILINVQSDW